MTPDDLQKARDLLGSYLAHDGVEWRRLDIYDLAMGLVDEIATLQRRCEDIRAQQKTAYDSIGKIESDAQRRINEARRQYLDRPHERGPRTGGDLEDILDTLTEFGNGGYETDVRQALDDLFKFRDECFLPMEKRLGEVVQERDAALAEVDRLREVRATNKTARAEDCEQYRHEVEAYAEAAFIAERDRRAMRDTLTACQGRCTELLERARKAEAVLGEVKAFATAVANYESDLSEPATGEMAERLMALLAHLEARG